MKLTAFILICILTCPLGYFVMDGIGKSYLNALKRTGGTVTAQDLMHYQNYGWYGAIGVFLIVCWLFAVKNDD